MTHRANDTRSHAGRAQIELLRSASVASRFARARSLSQSVIELARRALRRQNETMSEKEVLIEFVARSYGSELAEQLREVLSERS